MSSAPSNVYEKMCQQGVRLVDHQPCRAASTLSAAASSLSSATNATREELAHAEHLHKLRMQQHSNVCRAESTFNGGVLAGVNTLQDAEMNEVLRSVDHLMDASLQSIDGNDPVIATAVAAPHRPEYKAKSEPTVLIQG